MPSLVNRRCPVAGGSRLYYWVIVVFLVGSVGLGIPVLKVCIVAPSISICGLPLSKYLSFTYLGNAAWFYIVVGVVSAPIIPVLGCLVVYFWILLEMSTIAVTTFCGRFIDGGYVP